MSTWSERDLTCPSCAASVHARIALGAHIGRAPQIRDEVLARTFHRFTCACGHAITVQSRFEYTDIDRGQLLLVGTLAERATWQVLEDHLHGKLARLLEHGSPLTQPFVDRVKRRVVFGHEALREKLVIWDAALDDGVVECIKVRAFADDPTLFAPGSRLLVDRVTDGDALICRWFDADGYVRRELELPAEWVADASRDRASLEARFPELFRGGFVSVDRLRSA